MKAKLLGVAAVAGLMIAHASCHFAQADTIYSNFGPDQTYSIFAGRGVGSAAQFTSFGNYSLNQIDLTLGYESGTNGVIVSLLIDNNGVPGSLLGSWNVTSLDHFPPSSIQTISGISGINLSYGVSYFLRTEPMSGTQAVWNLNNTGALGTVCVLSNPISCQDNVTLPAFDVIGTPLAVPFPAVGTGLPELVAAGALLAWWRRKRATKIAT